MKLSEKKLQEIISVLCSLCVECHYVYDEAVLASRLVGVHEVDSRQVCTRLLSVLNRSNYLLDDLHCVESTLDDLLIQHKVLDDEEVV